MAKARPIAWEIAATFPPVRSTRRAWGRRAAAISSARSSRVERRGKGPIEQFHHVQHLLPRLVYFASCAHLQQATWICSNDGFGARFGGAMHLLGQQLQRSLRFGDVVNARRAATVIRQ